MTLTEFLLARIGEDEEWVEHPLFPEVVRSRVLREATFKRCALARHAREAVHTIAVMRESPGTDDDTPAWESTVVVDDEGAVIVSLDEPEMRCAHDIRNAPWPCPDLLLLAAIYSDHPDYDEEWKP